jgi:hypothetical protein
MKQSTHITLQILHNSEEFKEVERNLEIIPKDMIKIT